jgi:putative copper export protein
MLALGALHNFHFGKKAARLSGSEEGEIGSGDPSKLEQGFSRSIIVEAVLGIAVLLITAILVFQAPARSHPAMTSSGAAPTLVQDRR